MTTQHKAAEGNVEVLTEPKHEKRLKKQPLFKVLLHNDNYTTMEFVIWILRTVFHQSEANSLTITLRVHCNGIGIAGVYTHEIAETKVQKTLALAKEHEFPLKLSIEPYVDE